MERRTFLVGLAGLGAAAQAQEKRVPGTVAEVLRQLTGESGRLALAESAAGRLSARVPVVAKLSTDADVEAALDALVNSLPKGASWAKFWLPPPPEGKRWTGDDVAAFAIGLSRLFGDIGGVRDGQTEVLGKSVAADKAAGAIAALGLKPVYLVSYRPPVSFAGRWSATFGELTLKLSGNRATGVYTTNGGSIVGTVRGNRLDFTWYESANATQGKGYWILAEDGESFEGLWGNGDEVPARSWTGTRIGG